MGCWRRLGDRAEKLSLENYLFAGQVSTSVSSFSAHRVTAVHRIMFPVSLLAGLHLNNSSDRPETWWKWTEGQGGNIKFWCGSMYHPGNNTWMSGSCALAEVCLSVYTNIVSCHHFLGVVFITWSHLSTNTDNFFSLSYCCSFWNFSLTFMHLLYVPLHLSFFAQSVSAPKAYGEKNKTRMPIIC